LLAAALTNAPKLEAFADPSDNPIDQAVKREQTNA
jgi:hypothetical protein